jgi:hypothetical protein
VRIECCFSTIFLVGDGMGRKVSRGIEYTVVGKWGGWHAMPVQHSLPSQHALPDRTSQYHTYPTRLLQHNNNANIYT